MRAIMLLLAILSFVFQFAFSAEKKKFFIYDWIERKEYNGIDVYPPQGAPLHEESGYNHDFYDNNGAGKIIDTSNGLFQTWQFSLFKNVMARLYTSDERTRNPSEASAFIIPFDLGVHSYIDHLNGKPRLGSPHGWLVGQYMRSISANSTFWKLYGHDHFLFFSITAYQMVGIGVKNFLMEVCQNCSVISIETSPTNTATPYYANRHRKYWFSVPYPSAFHWFERIKSLPWAFSGDDRPILSLFIGSIYTSQPKANALRRLLFSQCATHNLADALSGSSFRPCEWHNASHACDGVVNVSTAMLLFRRSVFCPAPSGDSMTRKSLFDALTAGCIPVLFTRASLTQYRWHLTQSDVDDITVYIPMHSITDDGVDFMQVLRNISAESIRQKQRRIAALAPSLQYSVVPTSIFDINKHTDVPTGTTWRPPFLDASDVIIKRILDPATIAPVEGFSDSELLDKRREQKRIISTDPDYVGIRPEDAPSPPSPSGGGGSDSRKRIDARRDEHTPTTSVSNDSSSSTAGDSESNNGLRHGGKKKKKKRKGRKRQQPQGAGLTTTRLSSS